MRKKHLVAAAAVAATTAWAAPAASAETVYGLTDGGNLVTFDSATPQAVSAPITISGLTGTETLKAIDVRPATLQLYGVSNTGRLYRIDTVSGVATPIGGTQTIAGTDIDIDFNPTVDRLRLVSDGETNLRINPNTGAAATVDGNLAPAGNVTGAAYTKNAPASASYPNAPATTLLDIDTGSDQLLTQAPPNNGTLTGGLPLGVDLVGDVGFDISTVSTTADGTPGADTLYAVGRTADTNDRLYTINQTTGTATAVGEIAGTDKVKDISVAPPVPQVAVLYTPLVGAQQISTYRADRPGTALTTAGITGLTGSDTIVGIDRRTAASGTVYGLSANGNRLYTINVTTGAATLVAAVAPGTFGGTKFGLDFNPMADAIRLVSDTRENAAINPTTAAKTAQTALQYAAGDVNAAQTPHVTAAGYTAATSAAPPLRLFDIDTTLDTVVEQTPFAAGTLNTIPTNGPTAANKAGTLGVAVTDDNGYDIVARFNQEFAALQPQAVGGVPTLYSVNGSGSAPTTDNPPTVPVLSPANGSAALVGTLTLPSLGSVVAGMTVTNDNVLPAAPTPVATVAPTATATTTASPTATATSSYYGIPTATPTATVTPGTYTVKKRPGLTGKVRPKRDRKRPFKFKVTGKLKRPSGVSKSAGCKGKIKITVRKGKKVLAKKTTKVKSSCKYVKKNIRLKAKKAGRKGKAKFTISFRGNSKLLTKTIKRSARYGRK